MGETPKTARVEAPRQQFCFKNCTWTRVFVKLFMGPRPLPFSPPHGGGGFSLNLLTAERVCASFRGAAGRGYPALGTPPPPAPQAGAAPHTQRWRVV